MPQIQYELVALAGRALFMLLAALLVLRASLILLRQHRERKRQLRQLPDAGMVGEMRDIESDKSYPLPREGTLGGGRGCDIRLKGLRRRQLTFAYVPGKGILLTPCHRRSASWLDGVELRRGAYALHGALLRVGGYTLCIRLFAGLDVPEAATLQGNWTPLTGEEEAWAEEAGDIPLFDYAPGYDYQPPAPMPMPLPQEPPAAPPAYAPQPDFTPVQAMDEALPDLPEEAPSFLPEAPAESPAPRHRRSERRRGR